MRWSALRGLFRADPEQLSTRMGARYRRRREREIRDLATQSEAELRSQVLDFAYFDVTVSGKRLRDTPEVQRFLADFAADRMESADLSSYREGFFEAEQRLGVTWSEGHPRPGNAPIYVEMHVAADGSVWLDDLVAEWWRRRHG